jgi:hypothetical protein
MGDRNEDVSHGYSTGALCNRHIIHAEAPPRREPGLIRTEPQWQTRALFDESFSLRRWRQTRTASYPCRRALQMCVDETAPAK